MIFHSQGLPPVNVNGHCKLGRSIRKRSILKSEPLQVCLPIQDLAPPDRPTPKNVPERKIDVSVHFRYISGLFLVHFPFINMIDIDNIQKRQRLCRSCAVGMEHYNFKVQQICAHIVLGCEGGCRHHQVHSMGFSIGKTCSNRDQLCPEGLF